MTNCQSCGEAIPKERAKLTNGKPRIFCNQKCRFMNRFTKERTVSSCRACGEEIPKEKAKLTTGHPRLYCNMHCYKDWMFENSKGVRQASAVERHKDRAAINRAMKKAREGDTVARAYLRREHGVRGLWNQKTKEMERW